MHPEVISRSPRHPGPNRCAPLLFVHGAFGNARIWDQHFLPYFSEQGYAAHALSLRGHGENEPKGSIHLTGLADYVDDLNQAIHHLGVTPVLIGHSLGGVVVQKWLKHHEAPGVVLMGSGPPHGILPSSVGMLLRNPVLVMQLALAQMFGSGTLSAEATRKMLFSDDLPATVMKRHFSCSSVESLRVGLELIWPNFPGPTWNPEQPILVLGAERDFFISPTMAKATARVYGTRAEIIPDLAHAMMLESRWQVVADRILRWLEQSVAPGYP